MNYVTGQNCFCAVYHEEWCVSGGAIRRGSIIELDAHVFAPEFYLVGRKVRAIISDDDAVGDAVMMHDP